MPLPLQIVRLPPLEIVGTVRELELLGQLCVTNLQRLSPLNQRRNYVKSDTNFATVKHLLLKFLFQTLCAVDDFRMEGDFPPLPAHRTELARLAEMFPGVEKAVVELVLEGVQVWIQILYVLLNLLPILSRTIRTVVYVGPHIRFIRTTSSFIKDHLWSW